MGGSVERARYHFERSLQLSTGLRATPYLALATSVAVKEQDAEEFKRLLKGALQIDPDQEPQYRLLNIITQRKARWLLKNIEDYFLDEGD